MDTMDSMDTFLKINLKNETLRFGVRGLEVSGSGGSESLNIKGFSKTRDV